MAIVTSSRLGITWGGIENFTWTNSLSLTQTQTYNQRAAITKEGEVSQSEPAWAGPLLHRSNHPTLPETPHRDSHLFAFREDRNRTGPPPQPNPQPLTPPAPTPFISFFTLFSVLETAMDGSPKDFIKTCEWSTTYYPSTPPHPTPPQPYPSF